jgi:hypothetical protein
LLVVVAEIMLILECPVVPEVQEVIVKLNRLLILILLHQSLLLQVLQFQHKHILSQ